MSIELGGHIFSTPHLKPEQSVRVWQALGISVMDPGNGVVLDRYVVGKRP